MRSHRLPRSRGWGYGTIGGVSSGGGSGISATLNQVIDPITITAVGSHPVTGVLTQTLDPITVSATGAVAIAGTLSQTMSNLTSAATGTVAVAGTLSQAMSNLTSAATGTVAVAGTLSQTMSNLTISATGTTGGSNIVVTAGTIARWTGTPNAGVTVSSTSATVSTNDLLVLCSNCDTLNNTDSDATLTQTITNSAGTATVSSWTQRIKQDGHAATPGHAGIYTATVTTGGTLTISVSRVSTLGDSSGLRVSYKVYRVTGYNASPIGVTGSGTSATNNMTPTAYTGGTASGSYVFACATDWNQLGSPTSSDLTVDAADYATQVSVVSGYKASGGTAPTVNIDAGGTATAAWNWAALEIKSS
jgi:hypothetical protein